VKVAFVNSMRSVGGGERWLLETAGGLRERGHLVSIVARSGSKLADAAREDGHPVLELRMSGDLDPPSVLGLSGWLRRERPDVLSVNVQRAVRIGCVAARLSGVGAVVERRGLNFEVRPTALNRWVYRRCLSLVIANCGEIADGLVESGLVPSDRTVVVPNGIDPSRVPPGGGRELRSELGIDPAAPLVSVVARLVRDKGHVHAFDGFGRLLERVPRARLLIVGDGKLEAELRERAGEVAPDGSIIFAGRRDDVPAVLDASDALLVASLREGMPHSILEAMVAGTPIVATRIAGIPEMLAEGREALLVPPGSADAIGTALNRVLTEEGLGRRLSQAARRRVLADFSLDGMIEATERQFLRLARTSPGRGRVS